MTTETQNKLLIAAAIMDGLQRSLVDMPQTQKNVQEALSNVLDALHEAGNHTYDTIKQS